MKAWLTKIVTHPAGANAIGTIVGGIILSILFWLWTASGLSEPSKSVWPAFKAFSDWLNAPISMRRGSFITTMSLIVLGWCIAALIWLKGLQQRAEAIREQHRQIHDSARSASTETPAVTHRESLPTDELPAVFSAPPKKPPLPSPDEFSTPARKLLSLLYKGYGSKTLYLQTISPEVGLSFPACEKLSEQLADLNLITLIPTDEYQSARVSLTKVGRDYCLKYGFEERH